MNILIQAILALFVVVCFFMIFIILLQRPRSEGLGSAFGGGVTERMFGAGASDALIKMTVMLATLFFLLTLGFAALVAHRTSLAKSTTATLLSETQETAPQAAPTPEDSSSSTTLAEPKPGNPAGTKPDPIAPEDSPSSDGQSSKNEAANGSSKPNTP